MKLEHIEIEDLKPSSVNVRKRGGKEIADLLPSIRANGLLQPLLVRPNCEGFEIVAGQRRYHALLKLADEGIKDPVPCVIMQDGDDAKAIEASLAENVARLPMDEIDQYKAFAALVKQGKSVEDIAIDFGVTERLVRRKLAIGNLIDPILNAYRNEEINVYTLRTLTMATKKQQKMWWELHKSDDQHAPQGSALKEWLFGGDDISVEAALFDLAEYEGAVVPDLFGDETYFGDATNFWTLQNTAIAQAKGRYEQNGWEVVILDIGESWYSFEHAEASKEDGGRVYVEIARNGEVAFHEGYITGKEAKRREKAAASGEDHAPSADKPEITKPMQNYLALHRHAAVRAELLKHPGLALRLAVAQIIAGSELWRIYADAQKAHNEAVAKSLAANKAEARIAKERKEVRALLGIGDDKDGTLVYRKVDWGKGHDVHEVFAKLIDLDDASVSRILTFICAETLQSGSALVEALGHMLSVNMADHWQPDQAFVDLMRDKEAINGMVREAAGKAAAEAHLVSTAKVQKQVVQKCLDGTRTRGKADWQPRYMDFPMRAYTKRGGIDAVEDWKRVKGLFNEAKTAS